MREPVNYTYLIRSYSLPITCVNYIERMAKIWRCNKTQALTRIIEGFEKQKLLGELGKEDKFTK